MKVSRRTGSQHGAQQRPWVSWNHQSHLVPSVRKSDSLLLVQGRGRAISAFDRNQNLSGETSRPIAGLPCVVPRFPD